MCHYFITLDLHVNDVILNIFYSFCNGSERTKSTILLYTSMDYWIKKKSNKKATTA